MKKTSLITASKIKTNLKTKSTNCVNVKKGEVSSAAYSKYWRSYSKIKSKISFDDAPILISKAILSRDYKSASDIYVNKISEFKLFLKKISVESSVDWTNKYKHLIFTNITSILKKQISKETLRKLSLLDLQKRKDIDFIEQNLITDLNKCGLINSFDKLGNIKFMEINLMDSLRSSFYKDDNPKLLFKNIVLAMDSLKNAERNDVLNQLVLGHFRSGYSKDNKKEQFVISVNTHVHTYKQTIIHELLHNYLKKNSNNYWSKEIAVDFLADILTKKYFGEIRSRKPTKDLYSMQFYHGFVLYKEYVSKYGLNLEHLNEFLKSHQSFIEKNTITRW